MLAFRETVLSLCDRAHTEHFFVGYSGGLDSTLLLTLAVSTFGADRVTALHFNHQLQPEANDWAQHCANYAHKLGVNFVAESAQIVVQKSGTEAAARSARYTFFAKHIQTGSVLLLGHHLDDQAETVIYRIMRGSGTRGLAGMPAHRDFSSGQIVRPFLNVPRSSLVNLVSELGLAYIDDPSNESSDYDRNFIRHQVLPVLAQRWPNAACQLSNTARRASESEQLLARYADGLLTGCELGPASWGQSLNLERLLELDAAAQVLCVRHWLCQNNYLMPTESYLEESLAQWRDALDQPQSQTCVDVLAGGGSEGMFRVYRRRLYLLKKARYENPRPGAKMDFDKSARCYASEMGTLERLPSKRLTATLGCGQARVRILGYSHKKTLKNLFQELGVPPWERPFIPFIWRADELVCVANYRNWEAGDTPRFYWN